MVKRCGHNTAPSQVVSIEWFVDVGISARITNYDGPPFKSSEFAQFCLEWRVYHRKSSPYNQQLNRAAEAAVKDSEVADHKNNKNSNLDSDNFWRGTKSSAVPQELQASAQYS